MNFSKLVTGTLSILLFLMAALWSFSFRDFCLGDTILEFLNLKSWSNGNSGTHYTIFYSIIFLIPAIIIGSRHSKHFLSKVGKVASIILFLMIFLNFLFMAV